MTFDPPLGGESPPPLCEDEGFCDDVYDDDEWSTPVNKILRLPFDHDSWLHAQEILDAPSPRSRKIGDEARSIAARHIIDRLGESPSLLSRIHKVAPRLRSAVELLSKPDADYVYPKFQFVVNELRQKYPNVYTSITRNSGVRIPYDLKPSTILVSMGKWIIDGGGDTSSSSSMTWGKFASLVGVAGALAVDSVESDYPDGVAEIVETFGVLVEQILGEWILNEGGGWEGFISLNVYKAALPPVPRTILICSLFLIVVAAVVWVLAAVGAVGSGGAVSGGGEAIIGGADVQEGEEQGVGVQLLLQGEGSCPAVWRSYFGQQ